MYHERDGTVSTTLTPDRARDLCQYTYSRTEEVGRGNSCCPPFVHWYPLADIAFRRVQDTTVSHDNIQLWDVSYTKVNPSGLDLNKLATQEELLRLWWSKTPSTQPRGI